MTRAKVAFPVMLVLLVVSWLIISDHATKSHVDEDWSAIAVLGAIKHAYNNNDNRTCKSLEVALCPLARDPFTKRVRPHIKVFCDLGTSSGERFYAVGIFGTAFDEPVYVTGHAMNSWRKAKVCARDKCAIGDLSVLRWLLGN